VAELVPPGSSVADVGAGDGLLAAWLVARGHRVIATENKPGPLAVARQRLDPLGVECRLGDGLAPLEPGEVEVAVIAGMGGGTIGRILAASPEVVARLQALVLQPVQHGGEMLAGLLEQGFREAARIEAGQGSRRYTALLLLPPYSTAR
jgi:tRNA (adenine22-N1)-methyltransferase